VQAHADPPRYSRKWFGDIFFSCWGALLLLKLALGAFDWHRGGVLYWLVAAPLMVGFFAAGPPWLALGARDLVRNRQRVWSDAGIWFLVLVASLALGFAIVAVMWLVAGE
jgi:hypothetical protein